MPIHMRLTLAAVAAKLVEKQIPFEYTPLDGIDCIDTIFCPFKKAYSYDDTVRFTDSIGDDADNQKLITFFLY